MQSESPSSSSSALHGHLLRYGQGCRLAFQSAPQGGPSGRTALIFLGGLTDGFFSCGYIPPLADALTNEGFVLVQAMLRSAYRQYGISSLDDDVSDIRDLIKALKESEGIARVVLMGHSTGCQDICHLVRTVTQAEGPTGVQGLGIAGAILQAPVSDREYVMWAEPDKTTKNLRLSEDLISAGMGEELLPRDAMFDQAPITASRYSSLYGLGGADDYFSSDLSDADLAVKIGPMSLLPTLVLWSAKDEFVPACQAPRGDGGAVLANRLARAMSHGGASTAQLEILPGDHALNGLEKDVCRAVMGFLRLVHPSSS